MAHPVTKQQVIKLIGKHIVAVKRRVQSDGQTGPHLRQPVNPAAHQW